MLEASHRWPLVGLATLAAVAPFNIKMTNEPWTDVRLRPLVIVALVIVVVLVVHKLSSSDQRRPDWVDMLAYLWLAAIWISALVSDDVLVGVGSAARVSVPILLIPATRHVVRTTGDVATVLRALSTGLAIGAVVGLSLWLWGSNLDGTSVFVGKVTTLGPFDRLTRPWAHANVAAMAIGATIAAAAVIRRRWVRSLVLVLLTVAVVLTISRGGLLAVAAVGVTWIVIRRRRDEALVILALVLLAAVTFAGSSAWTTRVEQLGDEAFYTSAIEPPPAFEVGANDDLVDVTITNLSTTEWLQEGDERVLISARWFGPDGLIWTEDWWQLPHDLAPDQMATTGLTVDARLPVGSYEVRWDLVVPGTAYFGQFLGDEPIISDAEIVESDVSLGEFFRYELVERNLGIGRVDGWNLAWQEFRSAPLFGVGPNQFGDRATARLAEQQQDVGAHAHNIVLEPLATWGLAGTIPFLVLGAGALRRAISRAWRTRSRAASAIAVGLVAVVVHGLVDWPLVVITSGIPVGILAGLAWTDLDEL